MTAPMAALLIASMASSLMRPLTFSLINDTSGKGEFLPLLALSLMMKIIKKRVRRAGKRYNKMDKRF